LEEMISHPANDFVARFVKAQRLPTLTQQGGLS
jgi:ABC-type proline/glycine betaine transport system ATPase subunit